MSSFRILNLQLRGVFESSKGANVFAKPPVYVDLEALGTREHVPTKYSVPDINSPALDRNIDFNQRFTQLVGTLDGDHRCEEMRQRDLYQETQPLCAGDTV